MRADNSHHVIAASRRRSQATHRRAIAAVRQMDTTGMPITFDALAREAGVSRSWLYTQPDLRSEIERLRQQHRSTGRRRVPDPPRTYPTRSPPKQPTITNNAEQHAISVTPLQGTYPSLSVSPRSAGRTRLLLRWGIAGARQCEQAHPTACTRR